MSVTEITLTGPYDGIENSLETCTSELENSSASLFEACYNHTETIYGQIFEDAPIATSGSLTDSIDRSVLKQFIKDQQIASWFTDLNGRGSELDLGWDSFTAIIRLYTEYLYLKAFEAYKTASEAFSEIARYRQRAEDSFDDIERRLQRDQTELATENEDPLELLVSEATEIVAELSQLLESARTAVVRSHAYYAIADCYRDEYDFDSTAFSYVSLDDDPDWFFEDIRHRWDRAETRVRWARRDFSKLEAHANEEGYQ